MEFSYRARQYWRDLRRDDQVEHRREFWRAAAAVDAVDLHDLGNTEAGLELRKSVAAWLFDLEFMLENRAEEYAPIQALWEDVDLAGYATGLSEAAEALLPGLEAGHPTDFYFSAGIALNNAAVLLFDLPRRPPVIEHP